MSKVVNNEMQANSLADNKIQAKKPEVGDVWEYKYGLDKVYVLAINLIGERTRTLNFIDKGYVQQREYLTKGFVDDFRYLGKSKVKIEDLFNTENE